MSSKYLLLDEIRLDGGTQPRAEINLAVVAEYAEAMQDGAQFSPVQVFDDGDTYWLVDGFHRYHAARQIGVQIINALVMKGTQRDAVLYSVSANTMHGLRRTNEDKRKTVMTLLTDAEWSKWSDSEIAKRCVVTHGFVGDLRRSLASDASEKSQERTYITKHGTQAVMNTSNVGKSKPVQPKSQVECACDTCGEVFDKAVWHCPTCDDHWPETQPQCSGCRQPGLITTEIQKPIHSEPESPDQPQDMVVDDEKAELLRHLESLQRENDELRKDLEFSRADNRQITECLLQVKRENNALIKENKDLRKQKAELEKQLAEAKELSAAQANQIRKMDDQLEARWHDLEANQAEMWRMRQQHQNRC